MKAAEYIDAAKARLNVSSDYAIAKVIGVPKQRIGDWRTGKRPVPALIAVKLAIILERDPAAVIAELELEREKDPKAQAFWRDFLSRARTAIGATLAVIFIAAALIAAPGGRFGGADPTRGFWRRQCA